MNIKGLQWDGIKPAENSQKGVPQNLSQDTRFRSVLAMMQQDGLVAMDSAAQANSVPDDTQKSALRAAFNIGEMGSYADRRALLNELVKLGALSAEESELSMHQILPPQTTGTVVATGSGGMLGSLGAFAQSAELESMLGETNYLSYLEQAIRFDEMWSHSEDVKNARQKVHDVLQDIFG